MATDTAKQKAHKATHARVSGASASASASAAGASGSTAAEPRAKKPKLLKKAASTENLLFNFARPSTTTTIPAAEPSGMKASTPLPAALVHGGGGYISNKQRKKAAFRGKPILDDIALGTPSERAEAERRKRIVLGGDDVGASTAKREPGQYIAIDCEMVGVGPKGSESVLARVSLVNWHGFTLYDTFVKPAEKVTDYRTWVSGVRPRDLADAPSFADVQSRVAELIKGRTLVGHAIQNDLKALLLSHPFPLIRDTSAYQGLRDLAKTKHPSLRVLAKLVLDIDIQRHGDAHSSVEDARATMAIFRAHKSAWDQSLRRGPGKKGSSSGGGDDDADADADADEGLASADMTLDYGRDDSDSEVENGDQHGPDAKKGPASNAVAKSQGKRPAPDDADRRKAANANGGAENSRGPKGSEPRVGKGEGGPPPFKKKRAASKPEWWNDPL